MEGKGHGFRGFRGQKNQVQIKSCHVLGKPLYGEAAKGSFALSLPLWGSGLPANVHLSLPKLDGLEG